LAVPRFGAIGEIEPERKGVRGEECDQGKQEKITNELLRISERERLTFLTNKTMFLHIDGLYSCADDILVRRFIISATYPIHVVEEATGFPLAEPRLRGKKERRENEKTKKTHNPADSRNLT
jgi:hypothetical protein